MSPDISIIIPAKNEALNIGRCLTAIFRQETRFTFEVILIDSGSTDGTAEIAARWPVKIIEIPAVDFDHGRTRNMGFEAAGGKYLVALVADAVPSDKRWLEELIAPLEADPTIAGAYSRQIPPPDNHPLASARFAGLDPSRLIAEVHRWPGDERWENLGPMEKLKLVEFDDVSSVRRRSVWEQIPVAENYWAEDVDWSLKALRAGHKIAYAPSSVVLHAHRPSIFHDFKRAFVDQREASGRFGIILYANPMEALSSCVRTVARDIKLIIESKSSIGIKSYWVASSPFRRFLEVLGGYIGANLQMERNIQKDFYARFIFTNRKGDLRKTVFTLGGKRYNTVFAHPPSKWIWKVTARPGSKLAFFAGIDPEAHNKTAPVTFAVEVNDKRVWSCVLDPKENTADRQWRPGEVDLRRWEGRRVKIALTTEAERIENAWAGWGMPRVTADIGSIWGRLKIKSFDFIERTMTRTPPHHP